MTSGVDIVRMTLVATWDFGVDSFLKADIGLFSFFPLSLRYITMFKVSLVISQNVVV